MAHEFSHIPVLRAAVLALAARCAPQYLVDCTVGGAGHAEALLEAFPKARLLGIDRDPMAVHKATARLARFGARARVVHGSFSAVASHMQAVSWPQADVILADFGVSSFQLDTPARGFSFRTLGALDMRMDPTSGRPVAQLIAQMHESALADAIYTLGEERYSRPLARAILAQPPQTTLALADLVRQIVPRHNKNRIDPATRTFQALRMLVNQELEEIHMWLARAPQCLGSGGILMAISFHSLEDRAVKQALRRFSAPCTCPPAFPVCCCLQKPTLRVLTRKAHQADAAEVAANPRARSARLRAAQKL